MASRDEISSTEKLLDLIRSEAEPAAEVPPAPPKSKPRRSKNPIKGIKIRKRTGVGVEFGENDLRLVKVSTSGERSWELLGYSVVPYGPQMNPEAPGFEEFLKAALAEFCGRSGKFDLWALLPATTADIRHLRIPKVPKKQIPTAIYWTFKKESPFDEKTDMLDFEVLGEVVEDGVEKIAATVYSVPRAEVNRVRRLFAEIGYPLTGLTLPSFAAQNLVRRGALQSGEEIFSLLSVDLDSSRIDIFSGGHLALTRGVRTGINSMAAAIQEKLRDRALESAGAHINVDNLEDSLAEEASFEEPAPGQAAVPELEEARRMLDVFRPARGAPGAGRPQASQEELFDYLLPALERLAWQVERSFEHFALNLGPGAVARLFVTGEIAFFPRLMDYLVEQVPVPVEVFNPLSLQGAALPEAGVQAAGAGEDGFLSNALGAALSDAARTPNLLFAYQDKAKQSSIKRINRGIFAAFLPLMAAGLAFFVWQNWEIQGLQQQAAQAQEKLAAYSPRLDENIIMSMIARVMYEKRRTKEYVTRYLPVTVLGELGRITPANVRLLKLQARLTPPAKKAGRGAEGGEMAPDTAGQEAESALQAGGQEGEATGKPKEEPLHVVMEGLIFGDPQMLDSTLAGFLIHLESDPLFARPQVLDSRTEVVEGRRTLHFTVKLNLV